MMSAARRLAADKATRQRRILDALAELGDGATSDELAKRAGFSKRSTAATLGFLSIAGAVRVRHRTMRKKDGRWSRTAPA